MYSIYIRRPNPSQCHEEVFTCISEATDQASIDNARAVVEAKLGASGLNLLINNAGIMRYKGLKDTTAEDMMEQYKVNTIAPLMLTKVSGAEITFGKREIRFPLGKLKFRLI